MANKSNFPQVQSVLLLTVIDEWSSCLFLNPHAFLSCFVLLSCWGGGSWEGGWVGGWWSTHHRNTICLKNHFSYGDGGLTPKQVVQRCSGLHPWRQSKPYWTRPWATCSGLTLIWAGAWTWWSPGLPSCLSQPLIPWFCEVLPLPSSGTQPHHYLCNRWTSIPFSWHIQSLYQYMLLCYAFIFWFHFCVFPIVTRCFFWIYLVQWK